MANGRVYVFQDTGREKMHIPIGVCTNGQKIHRVGREKMAKKARGTTKGVHLNRLSKMLLRWRKEPDLVLY